MAATSWPHLLLLVLLVKFAVVLMEELHHHPDDLAAPQHQQQQETPGAIDAERNTDEILATPRECDSLKGDCPVLASEPMDPKHTLGEAELMKEGMEVFAKENIAEDHWKKTILDDKRGADGGIDDDEDAEDAEEFYEGSSVSSGGEESGHEVLAVVQAIEGAADAGQEVGVDGAVTPQADDGIDESNVQEKVESNTTAGELSTASEKKKVPLREILLRLKPASLMDDEERAAAAADRGEQEGNSTTAAGTVDSRSLALGGGLLNEDSSNSTPAANTSKRAVCAPSSTEDTVQLLNATGVQALVSPNANSTGRGQAAPCLLVFFFSPRCRFSAAAAPAMTALARALRGVMPVYGVDSVQHHSINAQYAVMGTPQLVLFHNSFSVAHYNASNFTPELLTSFLHHFTDYRLQDDVVITEEDLKDDGPLPLKASPGGGWWLAASWLLLGGVAGRCFVKSSLCHRLVEAVLNSWREAEAQHQHQD